MKETFIFERPHLRIFAAGMLSTRFGVGNFLPGVSATNRAKIVFAAFTESCWLTIASGKRLERPARERELLQA